MNSACQNPIIVFFLIAQTVSLRAAIFLELSGTTSYYFKGTTSSNVEMMGGGGIMEEVV